MACPECETYRCIVSAGYGNRIGRLLRVTVADRGYAAAAMSDEARKCGESSMATEQSADHRLKVAEERIQWVLDRPGMSDWVKGALRTARERNPVDVLNDLEVLNALLRTHAEARVDLALVRPEPGRRDEGEATGPSGHASFRPDR